MSETRRYETEKEIQEYILKNPGLTRGQLYSKLCVERDKKGQQRHAKAIATKIRNLLDKNAIILKEKKLFSSQQISTAQNAGTLSELTATQTGKKVSDPFTALYLIAPMDSFFYHIPFLVSMNERFDENDLADRANGFLGFYLKQGISEDAAAQDFVAKIRKHLDNPALSAFVRRDGFKWKVVCSENNLLLWRLYSMLHTVLFKSEKSKIGFAVELYGPLIVLLKDKLGQIEGKLAPLPENQRYATLLMYNGVQLETLLPRIQIASSEGDIRDSLSRLGIPLVIHDKGKDNETTLIQADSTNQRQ